MHGGFDSFLEEWYLMMKYLAGSGFEDIGFEGPGQGAVLRKHGFAFDFAWEKPVKAVLDFFDKKRSALFGLSKGGWLCMRAAADNAQAWLTNQLMYITKEEKPLKAFESYLALNEENIHSDNVFQDVLFLSGREDHFIPIRMHKKQVKALVNARTVTDRIFTKKEHAQNHCQIGNITLMLNVIIEWLKRGK